MPTTNAIIFFRQAFAMTVANLKCRYRKTFAGLAWVILCPILTLLAQAAVFGWLLHLQRDHYFLFLISGLIPWIFIAQALEMSTSVFVSSSHLIKSFSASPMVYLTAQIFDNLINFLLGFLIVLAPFVALEAGAHYQFLLLPLPILTLAFGVYGLAWILATLQVFFRDTRFLISFALQIGYYLTPVFYPLKLVGQNLRWIFMMNPIFHLIAPFQILINDFTISSFAWAIFRAAITSLILVVIAARIWRRNKDMVYFYV